MYAQINTYYYNKKCVCVYIYTPQCTNSLGKSSYIKNIIVLPYTTDL